MPEHILLELLISLGAGSLFRLPRDPDGHLRVSADGLENTPQVEDAGPFPVIRDPVGYGLKLGALLSFCRLASQTAYMQALADPERVASGNRHGQDMSASTSEFFSTQ